jgi:tRNA1(Val) A37 N6-methylase TrmN6
VSFADPELTNDSFLDGRLSVHQPRSGYRAGVDPVLLAAAVPAVFGQKVLELGCGVGVASLCLGQRVPGLHLTAVELQSDYADLAARNARDNGIQMDVVRADLRSLPASLKAQGFDHIIANPPYFSRSQGTSAQDTGRDISLAGETPLADWISVATQRLAPKGYLTLIQKAERLAEVLSLTDQRLGGVTVLPLAPRNGRAAELVIVQARKGGRGVFRLLSPLVLHEGDRHERDGESYSPQVRAILRDGAALSLKI